jgi:hypothetical protein
VAGHHHALPLGQAVEQIRQLLADEPDRDGVVGLLGAGVGQQVAERAARAVVADRLVEAARRERFG